ncbi:hypothetical protein [Duganella callida]|uniref:Uncharacterized protein n=1 Tax=Duganella callida TaxID=2561932 RepID=A0A4Y9S9C4_9BURK|nr:hypothetical protein [Duganella callida]TFW18292.1 hypothetical protein E4L98_18455 [Duganella callida]
MKLLKIEGGNGFFRMEDGNFLEIDKINKEHLLAIINATLASDVELDAFDEDALQNQAQRIVYKNIAEKLQNLASRRQEYKDESEKLFQKEYDKYSQAAA